AGLHARADRHGPRGAADGQRVRGLVAPRPRRGARRRAARRPHLLLLLRLGRGQRRLRLPRDRPHRGAARGGGGRRLSRPSPGGGRLRSLPSAAGKGAPGMRDAFIVGVGQTPVGEHWDRGLRELGAEAVRAALDDAGFETAGALYVGNMLGGCVNGQENVATLVADAAGLLPVEALKIEAACASGGAAVRAAALAVAAGACEVAVAAGVEKMTDGAPDG